MQCLIFRHSSTGKEKGNSKFADTGILSDLSCLPGKNGSNVQTWNGDGGGQGNMSVGCLKIMEKSLVDIFHGESYTANDFTCKGASP